MALVYTQSIKLYLLMLKLSKYIYNVGKWGIKWLTILLAKSLLGVIKMNSFILTVGEYSLSKDDKWCLCNGGIL